MANTMAMAIAQMLSSIVAGSRARKMWKASLPGQHRRRDAELAARRPLEELQVLHVDGLVEAEGLGQGRPGCRGGPLAEDRGDDAPGQGPQPEEEQQGQREHHSDHLEQASE